MCVQRYDGNYLPPEVRDPFSKLLEAPTIRPPAFARQFHAKSNGGYLCNT